MSKLFTTFMVALLGVSLVGCSLASFPIPEVPLTPSRSTEDRQACDRVAYEAGTSRPPIMSRWLVIPEVLFWPISEVVFLPTMIAMAGHPNESERAQLETWKQPYTCLITKGYKAQ
jgi:hypothetical protein